MISRRNFLGSVIGLWAGNSFLAKLITEPAQIFQPSHPEFEMCFKDSISGFTIRAPGVKDVISNFEHWTFIAHPLVVTQELALDSCLLYKHGILIKETKFNYQAYLMPGDTLSVTDCLNVYGSKTNDFDKAWEIYQKSIG